MTGNDVFKTALSFLSEKPKGGDLETFAISWLNILLQETLPTENSSRNSAEVLKSAPILITLDDVIPYNDNLTRVSLPYGLAAYIFADDDEPGKEQDYRNRYISSLSEYSKIKFVGARYAENY